jgi:hypothetical protein
MKKYTEPEITNKLEKLKKELDKLLKYRYWCGLDRSGKSYIAKTPFIKKGKNAEIKNIIIDDKLNKLGND